MEGVKGWIERTSKVTISMIPFIIVGLIYIVGIYKEFENWVYLIGVLIALYGIVRNFQIPNDKDSFESFEVAGYLVSISGGSLVFYAFLAFYYRYVGNQSAEWYKYFLLAYAILLLSGVRILIRKSSN